MVKNGNLLLIDFNGGAPRSDSQCSFYTVCSASVVGNCFYNPVVGLGGRYGCILGAPIPGRKLYSLIFL